MTFDSGRNLEFDQFEIASILFMKSIMLEIHADILACYDIRSLFEAFIKTELVFDNI